MHKYGAAHYRLYTGLLLGLFFGPEDEGSLFLKNVNSLSTNYSVISQKTDLLITAAVRTSNWNNVLVYLVLTCMLNMI